MTKKISLAVIYFVSFLVQYHVLQELEDTSSETMLLLWSMKERHNTDSQYKIYFDSLPEDFHTGTQSSCDIFSVSCLHFHSK